MTCLCAGTRRAARLLTLFYEERLRPSNLTPSQFELLSELRARPDLSQTELAVTLALDQTTLSRNLHLLAARHLLQPVPSSTDRRKTSYALTAGGTAAWHQALPLWQSAQQYMEQQLGSVGPTSAQTVLDQLGTAAASGL